MSILGFINPKLKSKNIERVRITDSKIMPCDSSKQLFAAKGAFTNYADSKNITIHFFDPRIWEHRMQELFPNEELAACVGISIRDKSKVKPIKIDIVNYFDEPKIPFIQKVFNKIQDFTEGSHTKPIEKMKEMTLQKLVKIGKIKP